jgi:polar amino acid transport system permease protein
VTTEVHHPSDIQLGRIAYRRGKAIRSVLVAALSTAVVGTALVVAITGAPGWERVRQSFFDPAIARRFLPDILDGFWLNVRLFVVCAAGALLLGLLAGVLRTLRGPVFFPVRALATLYTYSFRGGIESVHPSQLAAARSLGLSYRQSMRHVVLPQAVRRASPALLNDVVSMQKDVGLISLAGPIDAIRAAQIASAQTANFTPYVVAGVLFVLFALPVIGVTDFVTLRAARRQNAGT